MPTLKAFLTCFGVFATVQFEGEAPTGAIGSDGLHSHKGWWKADSAALPLAAAFASTRAATLASHGTNAPKAALQIGHLTSELGDIVLVVVGPLALACTR